MINKGALILIFFCKKATKSNWHILQNDWLKLKLDCVKTLIWVDKFAKFPVGLAGIAKAQQ